MRNIVYIKFAHPANKLKDFDFVIRSVALFSDGYNVQIVRLTTSVPAELFPEALMPSIKTRLSSSYLDWTGIVLATALYRNSAISMFWMTIVAGGIAVLGAGREYAVCTAQPLETADNNSGTHCKTGLLNAVSRTFAITSDLVVSSIVSLAVIAVFYDRRPRICFSIEYVHPLSIFAFRLRLADSRTFKKCCTVWFLYCSMLYHRLPALTLVKGFSSNEMIIKSVYWIALINSFALPRACFNEFLLGRIGQMATYTLGWAIVCVFGFVIGGTMLRLLHESPLLSFLPTSPGNCNLLVSSESFSGSLRGHFLCLTTAIGKASAIITLSRVLVDCSDVRHRQRVVFVAGSESRFWALCIDPTGFKEYLEQHGYDTLSVGL
ncbi:hypothetical protein K431DRAFT_318897 [Polychaeton citri CBS 116435]|uniref:Uncharacterized protein n=1 Tax=Polychaeton citri CBS 116435 TaxID=1314669 RepID=A0A9P4QF40_9PEZI|nr:hypothetical protein K431DRAFT_318897 [Polychaeton citri CBS 116435]